MAQSLFGPNVDWNRRDKRGAQATPMGNPYFDPSHGYGSAFGRNRRPNGDRFLKTGVGRQAFEANPGLGIRYKMSNWGLPDDDSDFGNFVNGQAQRIERGFQQAKLRAPNLGLNNYIGKLGRPGMGRADLIREQWNMLAPSEQGDDAPMMFGGPSRLIAY